MPMARTWCSPTKNGNLVIFREGDGTTTLKAYVSSDGVAWTRYLLAPPNTSGLNAMGGCQDSITHAFHLAWLDTSVSDQYARFQPTYTGGDITGFALVAAFGLFDDQADSPGPRDLAEIVDASGNHRLGGVHDKRTALGAFAQQFRTSPISTIFDYGVTVFIAVIFIVVGIFVLRAFVF